MKISVLAAARPDSLFLAQFLFSYFTHTADLANTELLVMHSARDTWNQGLFRYFRDHVTFVPEDYKLGRKGHHVYFNELAQRATGDWILELCEDMTFLTEGWDASFRSLAVVCNPTQVWMWRPHFKPADHAMAHFVSRGYLEAAGNLAECWSVDTWINKVFEHACPERVRNCDAVWFYDYTHDSRVQGWVKQPSSEVDPERVAAMPTWGEPRTEKLLRETVERAKGAIAAGR